ncbi:MAG: CHRD domain-containing protein [Thermoleophilia bacterium]|nr:CHRD domain-containing protein [Thermoleophilia bacterium]
MKHTLPLVLLLVLTLFAVGCATQTATTTTAATSTTGPSATSSTGPTSTAGMSFTTTSETTTTLAPFEPVATFTAELTGAEVVPPVDTQATGTATFSIDETGTRAYFKLTLSNINDVIASRLHEGKPGSNGSGLLILYPGPTVEGPFNGVIAQGYFNASALIGSLTGKTIADFAVLLQGGRAYVNVGTVQNPQGEIRGQIQ